MDGSTHGATKQCIGTVFVEKCETTNKSGIPVPLLKQL